MSHPNPHDDPENRYSSDSPISKINRKAKSRALVGRMKSPKKLINDLKERPGEAPLQKLKRLLK